MGSAKKQNPECRMLVRYDTNVYERPQAVEAILGILARRQFPIILPYPVEVADGHYYVDFYKQEDAVDVEGTIKLLFDSMYTKIVPYASVSRGLGKRRA